MQSYKKKLSDLVETLSQGDAENVYNYTVRYLETQELQAMKEVQALEVAGYNVTLNIPEEEWQAMLRRAELSEQMEKNK